MVVTGGGYERLEWMFFVLFLFCSVLVAFVLEHRIVSSSSHTTTTINTTAFAILILLLLVIIFENKSAPALLSSLT
jgi:hypothetical protein